MLTHARLALVLTFAVLASSACTSGSAGPATGYGSAGNGSAGAGAAGSGTGTAGIGAAGAGAAGATGAAGGGAAGTTGAAGMGAAGTAGAAGAGAAGTNGAAGTTGAAGAGAAGTTGAAGAGAAGTNGAAGTTGAAGLGGIGQDQMPSRPLNVTAAPKQYVHTIFGSSVGLDTRSAKMMGKMVIDLGVAGGGYQSYLGKRGFHVFGVSFYHCDGIDDWTRGRDWDGDCRLNTLDGMKHGTATTVQPADSIIGKVTAGLKMLQQMYPEEDWGYFLNADGTVRWSDVGFTGFSHGAQSAACFAHQLRIWRAVSQSGPRDNTCGKGPGTSDFDPANLPWNPVGPTCDGTHCCLDHIASWIDSPSATPIDRYYGFTGKMDGQFGDIMFSMDRMKYVGDFVNVFTAKAPYGGSHRFYGDTGHNGFPNGFPIESINIAFSVPPENQNPTF